MRSVRGHAVLPLGSTALVGDPLHGRWGVRSWRRWLRQRMLPRSMGLRAVHGRRLAPSRADRHRCPMLLVGVDGQGSLGRLRHLAGARCAPPRWPSSGFARSVWPDLLCRGGGALAVRAGGVVPSRRLQVGLPHCAPHLAASWWPRAFHGASVVFMRSAVLSGGFDVR